MLHVNAMLTIEQKYDYCQKMYRIAGLGMKLYNELGPGYAEAIYQECLAILCEENGVKCEREKQLHMVFHGHHLAKEYIADFVCYDDIIVELKATRQLLGEHRAQLFNYLRITCLHAGVLMNFGEEDRVHIERYLYNPSTNKYDLIHGNGGFHPTNYPGTNIPYDSLR